MAQRATNTPATSAIDTKASSPLVAVSNVRMMRSFDAGDMTGTDAYAFRYAAAQ